NGRPVRDTDSFTLALNNYRQAGGGGYDMIAGAEVVYDRQEDIRELLIAEVRRRGVIDPADYFVESWRLLPAAAADAALREQAEREIRQAEAPTLRPRVRVLAMNDFHGNLAPTRSGGGPAVGGAAALATYFDLEREGFAAVTLLLAGGDLLQGT